MAEPIGLKYRAFISYSHTDTSWAKWLHGKLEGFPIDKDLVGRETARAHGYGLLVRKGGDEDDGSSAAFRDQSFL